jgi:FkbM family methyltransferase
LNEIFAKEAYHFDTTLPSIVIDIGTNVGMAALYFAKKRNVKRVFGFEPFQETAEAANDNFRLNHQLSSKIHLENFGLSDKEEALSINYSFKAGQLASIKKTNLLLQEGSESELITVHVKKATQALETILRQYPNEKKILKIDTEGSEYEIIQDLRESGLLRSFDYIMVEWHGERYQVLVDILKSNKFKVVVTDQNYSSSFGDTGMIYARNEESN